MVVKHNHLVHNLFLRSQSIRTVSNLCISNPMASTNGKWFYYLSSPTQPSFVLCSLFILCAILFNQLVLTWQLLLSWSWVSAAPEKRNLSISYLFSWLCTNSVIICKPNFTTDIADWTAQLVGGWKMRLDISILMLMIFILN
jgi:hypothetical protein